MLSESSDSCNTLEATVPPATFSVTQARVYSHLIAGISFQDPAAKCIGHDEVAEVFRALKILKPKLLDAPTVSPSDSVFVADLHNEYVLRDKAVVRTHARAFLLYFINLNLGSDLKPDADFSHFLECTV